MAETIHGNMISKFFTTSLLQFFGLSFHKKNELVITKISKLISVFDKNTIN